MAMSISRGVSSSGGEDLLIQGRPLLKTELKGSSCCEDNRTVQTYEH